MLKNTTLVTIVALALTACSSNGGKNKDGQVKKDGVITKDGPIAQPDLPPGSDLPRTDGPAAKKDQSTAKTDGVKPADGPKPGADAVAWPCGSVTYEGCCDGTTLKWCDTDYDELVIEDCSGDPSCGWDQDGYYCGTSGAAEPTNTYPMKCP
jgi:hypothetical protein